MTGIAEIDQLSVSKLALRLRWGEFQHALDFADVLGEPANNDSLTSDEFLSHAHDIPPKHGRYYKSFICYPLKQMGEVNVSIIRVAPS